MYEDFDRTIHSAIYAVWPEIGLNGCRVYLEQLWWRKIQDLKLSIYYRNKNSKNETFFKVHNIWIAIFNTR